MPNRLAINGLASRLAFALRPRLTLRPDSDALVRFAAMAGRVRAEFFLTGLVGISYVTLKGRPFLPLSCHDVSLFVADTAHNVNRRLAAVEIRVVPTSGAIF